MPCKNLLAISDETPSTSYPYRGATNDSTALDQTRCNQKATSTVRLSHATSAL